MLILAVDVGIKNIALCALDTCWENPCVVHWANEPLSEGREYKPMHNVQYVHEYSQLCPL